MEGKFTKNKAKPIVFWPSILFTILSANSAYAADGINSGDTAWLLISTGLVLFMMIPGLAMFYAGLVRVKNVLSLYMQCFCITALVTILWTIYGYSLAFDTTGMDPGVRGLHAFIGGLSKVFLAGVTIDSVFGTIPEPVFFAFPAYLCHNNTRSYNWSVCREDEVLCNALVYGTLAYVCISSHLSHDVERPRLFLW